MADAVGSAPANGARLPFNSTPFAAMTTADHACFTPRTADGRAFGFRRAGGGY
jgi:hypothetical protein